MVKVADFGDLVQWRRHAYWQRTLVGSFGRGRRATARLNWNSFGEDTGRFHKGRFIKKPLETSTGLWLPVFNYFERGREVPFISSLGKTPILASSFTVKKR